MSLHIRNDRTAGTVEVRIVTPMGYSHEVEDSGVDGLVLLGNSQVNWHTKTYTWAEMEQQGFTAFTPAEDAEITLGDVKAACGGTLPEA